MPRSKAFFRRTILALCTCALLFNSANFAAQAIGPGGFGEDPCVGASCFSPPPKDSVDQNINTERTFREQVITIINYFLGFVGLLAVVAIIYGGFLWILSGGEEENVTKGRKIVIWAGAGIILILLSFTIVRLFVNAGGAPGTRTLPDGSVQLTDRISVVISGGPASGQAPLSIELSGTSSRYPGIDQTIPDSAYHWSYIDKSGKTLDLGTGPTIRQTLKEAGRFVFTLRIDARPQGPEKEAGISTFAIEVLSTTAPTNFNINGQVAKFFQQFTATEAASGISFVPAAPLSGGSRSVEYAWDFGDGSSIIKTAGPEAITHTFRGNGEYRVSLTATDEFGKASTTNVTVAIVDVAARMQVSPEKKVVGEPVSFNAADSESSFGEILEYVWTIVDSSGESVEVREKNFSRTFARGGNIQVTLNVRDSIGKTGTASTVVTITSHPPVANFSFMPKSDSLPATFVFDGGLSSDIDNDPLFYSWDFENDGSFEILDNNSSKTEFTFKEKGGYNVKLRVKDRGGETAEKVIRIEVTSVLNVDFTADRFVAHPSEEIHFSAKSENGITFFWDFGDGVNDQGESSSAVHSYKKKGKYTVKLTVFDREDHENSMERTVFVGESDMPVAAFDLQRDGIFAQIKKDICGSGKSGIAVSRAENIRFDASSSINRSGEKSKLEYEWVFHDGTLSKEASFERRFNETPDENACFPVKLTVKDTETGKKDTAETIWLKIENLPPLLSALIVSIPQNTIAPVVVPLQAQNASDRDGTIVEYKWWAYRQGSTEKIGLHTTTTPATSIILPVFGLENETNTYYFVVEIKDNFGAKINSEEIFGKSSFIVVKNGQNRSPIVDFQMEKTSIDEGDTIGFFAEASDPLGGTIPDSGYFWDFNGDNIFDAVGTGPQVTHRFEVPGEFEVRLKVVHRGLSSSKSRTVFVARKHKLPKAAFNFSIQGHNVVFNAGNSEVDASVSGNTKSFAWDFDAATDTDGDGVADNDIESTDERVKHFYQNFANYSVKLTIRDRLGVEDTVTREVPVSESGRVISPDGTQPQGTSASLRESIRLNASHPITTLDLVLQQGAVNVGEKVPLLIFVKNANNTLFSGAITIKVVSGSATITPENITALAGEARAEVAGTAKGRVLLEVTAKDTVSGDLSEEILLTVE